MLWTILAGDATDWGFALLLVTAVAWVSLTLMPPGVIRLSPLGTLRFLPFFLRYSLRGAIDVARCALSSPRAMNPAIIEVQLRLPDGPGRTFYVAVIGLLPGTLSTGVEAETLRVHLLDQTADSRPQLRMLEARVGHAFSIDLGE